MSKLSAEQELNYAQTKFRRYLKKLQLVVDCGREGKNFALFKAYYEDLHKEFEEIHDLFDEMSRLCIKLEKSDLKEEIDNITEDIDSLFYEARSINFVIKEKTQTSEGKPCLSKQINVKLPKLNLPTFSGINLSEWVHFKELFSSLIIDNNTLSGIEKYQYLLTCLSEPALGIVSTLPVTSSNFEPAWKALLCRYDNKRLLAVDHIERLLNYTPLPTKPTLVHLQAFLNTFRENVGALKQLSLNDPTDFIFLNLALRNLDAVTRDRFETEHAKVEVPTFSDLINFLEARCKVVEVSSLQRSSESSKVPNASSSRQQSKRTTFFTAPERASDLFCPSCKGKHCLYLCPTFINLTPHQRLNKAKAFRVCFNCLSPQHMVGKCTSQVRCKYCSKTHHSLLHLRAEVDQQNESISRNSVPSAGTSGSSEERSVLSSFSNQSLGKGLLGTAVVRISDAVGRPAKVRVVIDTGSHISFITRDCLDKLGLPTKPCNLSLSGLGQTALSHCNEQTSCSITSRFSAASVLRAEPFVTTSIYSDLPSSLVPLEVSRRFASLKLADPKFWLPNKIDLLLGSDLFLQLLPNRPKPPIKGNPGAIDTIFGWVVLGPLAIENAMNSVALFVNSAPQVEKLIERFWETEEPSLKQIENPENIKCEEFFSETHSRDSTGRYVVALPFKKTPPVFEKAQQNAQQRFLRLENKLRRQPELRMEYHAFMQEYINLNHMSLANQDSLYTIPHHAVIKADSSTTRLRVVFDASARTSIGSLNDYLYTGPKLQLDICEILMNFRLHRLAFTADICKMYRQILVRPQDRAYQHIWWRFSEDDLLQKYELHTVTYGLSSAPYLALRVLRQLVQDEGKKYPLAAEKLQQAIYIDDIVTGVDSVEEAMELQNQLTELLACGGFELRKWTSNSSEFLDVFPETHIEQPRSFSDSDDLVIKVLGLQWDPDMDCFSYRITSVGDISTKRGVLSTIARIFDPLGWLAPVVFKAKFIMQQTWLAGIGWDDDLPGDLLVFWKEFVLELPTLSNIHVPRYLGEVHNHHVRILGFSDASERGYSAVLYAQYCDNENNSHVHVLKAKTKLAPVKTISIPRLELCGALLLAQCLKSIEPFLDKLRSFDVYLWSDSTIVLTWINTSPHLLKTFIANRVTKILEYTSVENWFYICSEHNPADCASRGINPSSLEGHQLWWNGPVWLRKAFEVWPLSQPPLCKKNIPEFKEKQTVLLVSECFDWPQFFSRFSKFSRLQHTVAYLYRFINNCKCSKENRQVGALTILELSAATQHCVRITQSFYFKSEICSLQKGLTPPTFARLAPYLDSVGMVHVGGRLRHSDLPMCSKFPLLLPQKAHLTVLLIDYYHKLYGHAGPQLLQSLLSRYYWIISARRIIRQRIFLCNICFRLKATPVNPFMSDLPASRCRQSRPFQHVGVDFAGPFLVKDSLKRNAKVSKCYLAIFVCMATKALHLEAVSGLSSEVFLATFDRFVARRGLPSHIYSDCGTNFVGASRHLRELLDFIDQPTVQGRLHHHLTRQGVVWKFNPPSAPNFGGIWEAGVKSCKYHLTRIAGNRPLTFEELTTLFARIEAILNSRPLCSLSSSPNEVDVLTPGHFLIGGPLVALPEPSLLDIKENRLSRWQLVQQTVQHVWKRWHLEYLHTLQQRTKWTKQFENVKEGTVVLLFDSNSSPLDWKLGCIEKIHPGTDGTVRVVTVRTPAGSLIRPISKVVVLPTSA